MKEQNIREDERPVFEITSTNLGPHRQKVIYLKKDTWIDNHKSFFVWTLAAIVMGISLASFFIELGGTVVSYIKKSQSPKEHIVIASDTGQDKKLGSDDLPFTFDSVQSQRSGTYEILPNKPVPKTSALSYLIGDVETGDILLDKNPEIVFPIASISKLMTAIVAKDLLDLHEFVTVTRSSVDTYGTFGGLYSGEKILITDLLYPLLIESSNDAAEVLAYGLGREGFLKAMNEKAKALGMNDTYFDDPSGLSFLNVSNTVDLFSLARFIYKELPEIFDITRINEYAIPKHRWVNGNSLSRKSSFVGGKNGYTDEALRTTASIFELNLKQKDNLSKTVKRKIAIIVLKSNDREGDVDKLIRFAENAFVFAPKN